jgi:hypothetical protein
MSTGELRQRVFELGRRQTALVEEAVANAYSSTADPNIRRAAIEWALVAVPEVQEAALHTDPLVALGDLWALGLQTETFAREGPGRTRLGPAYVYVERAAGQMTRESESLAMVVFGADLPGPRDKVEQWARDNSITSGTFMRPSASVAFPRALGGEKKGAFAMLASTDDRLTQLSARIEMMNATLLDRVRWTSELLIRDALGADSAASMLDNVAGLVDKQRQSIIKDLTEQRDQIVAEVSRQREAAFADIARERTEIFAKVRDERAALTTDADRLLQQANANVRGLINRTLLFIGLGAALLIVLAACAAWIVRNTTRRPRRPAGQARRGAPPTFGPVGAPTA